jgi:hypothetical protein
MNLPCDTTRAITLGVLRVRNERARRTDREPRSFIVTAHPLEWLRWNTLRAYGMNDEREITRHPPKHGILFAQVAGAHCVPNDTMPLGAFTIWIDGVLHDTILTEWPEWIEAIQ